MKLIVPKGVDLVTERRSHYLLVTEHITARWLFQTATEVLVQVTHRRYNGGKEVLRLGMTWRQTFWI